MCFQRSSEGIEGKSRTPQSGWKIVPQSTTGCRETPVAKFVVCSWHKQLLDVIGMRPQCTTTSVRQKMTVTVWVRPYKGFSRQMGMVRRQNPRRHFKISPENLHARIAH